MLHSSLSLFDVPSSAGCLEEGTNLFAHHLRANGIKELFTSKGKKVNDLGMVDCAGLPRHNVAPIRNYPSPKIVWERTIQFMKNNRTSLTTGVSVCLGGDCSIVVGTATGFMDIYGTENVHLIYVDGDVDSTKPDPQRCVGSAGMGLWFLTQVSEYWKGPKIDQKQITVIGNKQPPFDDVGIPFISLDDLIGKDIEEYAKEILSGIPQEKIFVHFDVDVISQGEMPASYSPRGRGLSLKQTEILLKTICSDPRVGFFEITEFMPAKDPDGILGKELSSLVASCALRI